VKKKNGSGKALLTRAEVARIFQVSPSTITRWADSGILPSVKTLGGHRRYETQAVMALAQQQNKQEASMEKVVFEVPTMYGDHHVLEVRRILLEMTGVEDVLASSSFHAVEVDYDAGKISPEALEAKLDAAGYLGALDVPHESGIAVTQDAKKDASIFFRHTAAHEQVKDTVSFGQDVAHTGRPLWPCPGVGALTMDD